MGNYTRKADRHSRRFSRDGKKLSPKDCYVEEEIAESKSEEGEALPFQEDDDSYIDPYALSYVDEKLHNVLGHFLKDFQGDLSAEKLGAMFGGYGSFLGPFESSPPRAQSSGSGSGSGRRRRRARGSGTNESKEIKHIEKSTSSPSHLVKEEDKVLEPVEKSSVLYNGLDSPTTDSEDGLDFGITL